jgi:hypothetical protein
MKNGVVISCMDRVKRRFSTRAVSTRHEARFLVRNLGWTIEARERDGGWLKALRHLGV